jgi:hypothetical protein
MGCNRGKASPDTNTQRRLFAASGGYCQNPGCNQALFVEAHSDKVSVAEMAHIYSAEDQGPRANLDFTAEERGSFANLIVLCANCHTVIDKAPDAFPDDVITAWKQEHEARIAAVFGSVSYKTRNEAREALLALTARTGSIHRRVGPDGEYKWNPEADEAAEWQHHVRQTIIPTNRSVLTLLDRNRNLLHDCEIETVEIFRQHIDGVEQRHVFDSPLPSAPTYPQGMAVLFTDGENT